MKSRLLGSVAAVMLAAGLAQGQQPWGPPPFPPPYGPPPPWAQPFPPPPPRYYYPPPPPPPYGYGPMVPRYGYPPYAPPAPAYAEPARTAEPPVAAAPKEAPAAGAAATGPAVAQIVDQDRGPCLRFWLTPEYLYWVASPGHTPPLVTTGPAGTVQAGTLGTPGTSTLYGGNINYPGMSGVRLSIGAWIDPDNKFAVEAQGFVFEQGVKNYSNGSNGNGSPVLAVPIYNISTGSEGQFTISNPNGAQGTTPGVPLLGSVNITSVTRLYGAEFNGYYNLFRYSGLAVDVLGGFRYLGLQEGLSLNTNLNDPTLAVLQSTSDSFSTNNQFFGGQLGIRATYQRGPAFVMGVIKCAVGVNNQTVDINGSTIVSGPGAPNAGTYAGGILTQPSNIGQQTQMGLSVVPQGQIKLGWEFTPYMRVFAGYDFMYWSGVVRPGDQIDRNVNPSQAQGGILVGAALPAAMFNRTNYFIQGVSAGIEFRY